MENFPKLFNRMQGAFLRIFAGYLNFGPRYCCFCKKRSFYFLSFKGGLKGFSNFFKLMDIIGSDVKNHACPKCGCHDRERHLKLYFDSLELKELVAKSRVLHFAPERFFSEYIFSMKPVLYLKADLCPVSSDVKKLDITKTNFLNDSFDLVIANHVLEHVKDDSAALREIWRVLRLGGLAVLQTPYSAVLSKKFEDDGINADELRAEVYGQEDHVRLYGSDFVNYVENFGFSGQIRQHSDVLASVDAGEYGVNIREPFLIFEKIRN